MGLSTSIAIILLSLSAIPITYIVNTAHSLHGEQGLLWSGVVCLSSICLATYFIIKRKGAPPDPFYYVLSVCAFGGVASVIIALEADGVIKGFISGYLTEGEPYLTTSHGIMISYWDGMGQYAMLMLILLAIGTQRSYREVGLYWAGSFGHSMIVFIPGSVIGKFGIKPSFLLNVPYMFIPFWSMARFLRERPKTYLQQKARLRRVWHKALDTLLILCLIISTAVACFRGFAALDAPNVLFTTYRDQYEPYMKDPVSYAKIQMLVYMFYFVPFYVLAVYGLIYPGSAWLPDWSLIYAGAAAQAQVSHIGSSLHAGTDPELRVPEDPDVRMWFWTINVLLLLVVPQILALRCNIDKSFFVSDSAALEKPKSAKLKKNE